ncbi:MAG: hypothetical protein RL336_1416 [Pseudomonadota bacterium]|jgi:hypothetical protein
MEDKELHKSFWLQEAWHIEREGVRAANMGKSDLDCPYMGDWRADLWREGHRQAAHQA